MKKLTIAITDEAHLELLSIQLERKRDKQEKTTLADVAGDVFSKYLEEKAKQKAKIKP